MRIRGILVALIILVFAVAPVTQAAQPQQKSRQRLETRDNRDTRRMISLMEEVRHQLVTLPYYSVFDWLQAEVKPDGTVILKGEVARPSLKSDAEARVKHLEGATRVINNIEVLPLSPMDDDLRMALYQNIFKYSGPLFRYALQSVPPIHIIVKNGHVTLKGVVASPMDSQLAYTAAREVPGVFDVQNELRVERASETDKTTR